MIFRIGDKVTFNKYYNNNYNNNLPSIGERLNLREIYIINNRAIDFTGSSFFYSVLDKYNKEFFWYTDDAFISLKKARKDKLRKIKLVSEGWNIIIK